MPKSSHVPAFEEVEASGEWVSYRNNPHGFTFHQLWTWKDCCPYLPDRKLDSEERLVVLDGARRKIRFYHRPSLDKIKPLFDRGEKPFASYKDGQATRIPDRIAVAEHGHLRGALGMKHTAETKARLSEKSVWAHLRRTPEEKIKSAIKASKTRAANGTPSNPHGKWKAAWRVVGGRNVFFRSRWEANYARFLEWQKCRGDIVEWEHEPKTFWFEGVKRGVISYLPDFRVTKMGGAIEYHEVKGWMDAKSKTKIKRMRKYYPEETLVVIDSKAYTKLAKLICTTIDGWE